MTRGGDASSGGEKEVHSPSICFSLSSIPTGFVLSSVQCRLPPTFPLFPVYDDPMPTKGDDLEFSIFCRKGPKPPKKGQHEDAVVF
ncbi:hypothetical protein ACS0TY_023964 [Phlomoides rotata]